MSVDVSALSRVLGIDVTPRNFNVGSAVFLPQRIAIIGQGNSNAQYTLDKYSVTTLGDVAEKYGYGSPIHLACRMLFPTNNDGIGGIPVTIYPLADKESSVAANGEITVTGNATEQKSVKIYIGGIACQFLVSKGDNADSVLTKIKTSIDSVLEMPVTTGEISDSKLPITAKWKGESGNQISIDISEAIVKGLTFSMTKFANGALNPDVDTALNKIGEVWETFILNLLNYDDEDTLSKYRNFGEGRWNNLIRKPCLVANGCTDDFNTRTAITNGDAQITDRINFLITSVGSRELPFCIAARGLAKDIVSTANNNPPQNYKGYLTQLEAGKDEEQEDYTVRNNAVKLGSSTNIKVGNTAVLNDIVTFYHPANDDIGVYKYVCDLVKIMNVLFNCELIFASDEWKGVPLLPDSAVTENPTAKQPKNAKAALMTLADSLEKNAIISDKEFTKANITASIDKQNPKRINWTFPVKISGNVEIISGDIYVGVYLEK